MFLTGIAFCTDILMFSGYSADTDQTSHSAESAPGLHYLYVSFCGGEHIAQNYMMFLKLIHVTLKEAYSSGF